MKLKLKKDKFLDSKIYYWFEYDSVSVSIASQSVFRSFNSMIRFYFFKWKKDPKDGKSKYMWHPSWRKDCIQRFKSLKEYVKKII